MSRNVRFYLEDIQENSLFVLEYTKRMSYKRFTRDTKTVMATIKHLENIGEAARHLPQSLKARYPDVKWDEMIALRNVLVHHYFGINYLLIWATVKDDIPPLYQRIISILDSEPPVINE